MLLETQNRTWPSSELATQGRVRYRATLPRSAAGRSLKKSLS